MRCCRHSYTIPTTFHLLQGRSDPNAFKSEFVFITSPFRPNKQTDSQQWCVIALQVVRPWSPPLTRIGLCEYDCDICILGLIVPAWWDFPADVGRFSPLERRLQACQLWSSSSEWFVAGIWIEEGVCVFVNRFSRDKEECAFEEHNNRNGKEIRRRKRHEKRRMEDWREKEDLREQRRRGEVLAPENAS